MKKPMRTLLAVGLALGAMSLTACGSGGTSTETPTNNGSNALAAMVPEPIRAEGKILIAGDYSKVPSGFVDGSDYKGYNIDICNEIGERLGLEVEFVNLEFAGLIAGLSADRFDMICSGMWITEERAAGLHFVPYIENGQSLMVSAGNPDGIKGLGDLCGKAATALAGSASEAKLAEQSEICKKAGSPAVDVRAFQDMPSAGQEVLNGRATALLGDDPIVAYLADQQGGEVAESGIESNLAGLAVPQDAAQLSGALTAALYEMKMDGTYAEILDKWSVSSIGIDFF